jgi:hypothetical protein
MLKKVLKLSIGLFIIGSSSFGQTWDGSTLPTGNTYRDGNVGIGTSTPAAKLDVNGNAIIGTQGSSSLIINDVPGARYMIATGNSNLSFKKHNPSSGIFQDFFVLHNSGNIGIGNANPISRIHMSGLNLGLNAGDKINHLTMENGCGAFNASYLNFYTYRNEAGDSWLSATSRIQQTVDATPMGFIEFNPKGLLHGLALGTNNQSQFYINGNGQVAIGSTSFGTGNTKLTVEGKISARGIKVTIGAFPDYVFDSTYQLTSLASLNNYINQNKHLPGIPSAAEVEKEDGVELGDMSVKLLEKVEELTLYILELNKKLEAQQKKIERLEKAASN